MSRTILFYKKNRIKKEHSIVMELFFLAFITKKYAVFGVEYVLGK